MYRYLFFIVMFCGVVSQPSRSQPNFTYELTSSEKCAHVTDGTSKQILPPAAVDWYLGKDSDGNRRRGFFQWSLPDEIIPDGSTVNSVRLYMRVSPDGHRMELAAILYGMELDVDQASAQLLWQRSDYFNGQVEYRIGSASSTNYVVDETFESGSDFAKAIESALVDNFFTLGVVEQREITQSYPFRLTGLDVKLEIHYTPPQQEVLVDQKRFDNVTPFEGMGLWEGGFNFKSHAVPHAFTFYQKTKRVKCNS